MEIKLLGYVISENTIAMDSDKIKSIELISAPKNVKELQSVLGLTNYYSHFILEYATITIPLVNLLKKDVCFKWSNECEEALNKLKTALISYPTLRIVNFSLPFRLYTDASSYAIAGVLSQIDLDGNEYVIYYLSRVLKGAELNYTVSEKEALAVVWAVKYLTHYLYGTKFTIITDHSALKWLMSIKEPTGRLMRWAMILQCYDFEIVYRAGACHQNADALSRIPEKQNDSRSPKPINMLTRQILVSTRAMSKRVETELTRLHEVYDDENLLHFLKFKKHLKSANNQCREKTFQMLPFFYWQENRVLVRRSVNSETFLTIPRKHERDDIIAKAHLFGHAATVSTVNRIEMDGYTWGCIKSDVEEY